MDTFTTNFNKIPTLPLPSSAPFFCTPHKRSLKSFYCIRGVKKTCKQLKISDSWKKLCNIWVLQSKNCVIHSFHLSKSLFSKLWAISRPSISDFFYLSVEIKIFFSFRSDDVSSKAMVSDKSRPKLNFLLICLHEHRFALGVPKHTSEDLFIFIQRDWW